jgi:hypothetical protein
MGNRSASEKHAVDESTREEQDKSHHRASSKERLTQSDRNAVLWYISHSPSIGCALAIRAGGGTDHESAMTDGLLRDTERHRGIKDLLSRMKPKRLAVVLMRYCAPPPPMLGAWRDLAGVVDLTEQAAAYAKREGAKGRRGKLPALVGLSARSLAGAGQDPATDRMHVSLLRTAAQTLVQEAIVEWNRLRHNYGERSFAMPRVKPYKPAA